MGVVDYEAAWVDLRRELREARSSTGDRRTSWGRPHLLELLDELEVRHRIDESSDQRTLRRFAAGLTDTFMGLLPRTSPTDDPLAGDDRVSRETTSRAMDGGGAHTMTQGGHDGRTDRHPAAAVR